MTAAQPHSTEDRGHAEERGNDHGQRARQPMEMTAALQATIDAHPDARVVVIDDDGAPIPVAGSSEPDAGGAPDRTWYVAARSVGLAPPEPPGPRALPLTQLRDIAEAQRAAAPPSRHGSAARRVRSSAVQHARRAARRLRRLLPRRDDRHTAGG